MNFDKLMNGRVSNLPSDFYYKITSNGRKLYYNKITGNIISKDNISKDIIDNIQQFIEDKDAAELTNFIIKRDKIIEQIRLLRLNLDEIDSNIELNQRKSGNIKSSTNLDDYNRIIKEKVDNYKNHKKTQNLREPWHENRT